MLLPIKLRRSAAIFLLGISAALPLASVLCSAQSSAANQVKSEDPWSKAQVLQPADFAVELGNTKGESAPTIVYVGFRTLFEGGHVPGSSYHGTASTEKGIAELKKWIATLPRTTRLVIYCGCCPFDHCPNIRPAYSALHDMGFTRVRVLVLPTSFAVDWVEKGYPMQKGL
ncbi:MAG TPA: rhodanese-like domain-containing protein [Candidatus Acidoferrum sp.]|nr:rhodanese-like domain-containing protein [Candidatus Acidoferrum sp.]